MTTHPAFFKAQNKQQAVSEILQRLGGSSPATDALCEFLLDIGKNHASMKKFPMAVFVHESKPAFHLNDGEMLDGYAFDLTSMKVVSQKYMGSGDSVMHHQKEQLSSGMTTPMNLIAIFITKIPSGGKLAWTVDIVGQMLKKIETNEPVVLSPMEETLQNAKQILHENVNKRSFQFNDQEIFEVDFSRKVDPNHEDLVYYLGELEVKRSVAQSTNWSLIVHKRDDGLNFHFEYQGDLPISRRQFQILENQMGDFDSDIRRIKRK